MLLFNYLFLYITKPTIQTTSITAIIPIVVKSKPLFCVAAVVLFAVLFAVTLFVALVVLVEFDCVPVVEEAEELLESLELEELAELEELPELPELEEPPEPDEPDELAAGALSTGCALDASPPVLVTSSG